MANNYEKQVELSRQLFLGYDLEEIRRKFAFPSGEFFPLTFLGAEYRVQAATGRVQKKTGERWAETTGFNEVMSIYDLLTNPNGKPQSAGTWRTVSDMNRVRSGGKTLGTGLLEGAEAFRGKGEALLRALVQMGGKKAAVGDAAAILPVFEGLPVYVQFWDGDEEFAPRLRILWDGNTTRYIHFETTFYVTEHLLDLLGRRVLSGEESV